MSYPAAFERNAEALGGKKIGAPPVPSSEPPSPVRTTNIRMFREITGAAYRQGHRKILAGYRW